MAGLTDQGKQHQCLGLARRKLVTCGSSTQTLAGAPTHLEPGDSPVENGNDPCGNGVNGGAVAEIAGVWCDNQLHEQERCLAVGVMQADVHAARCHVNVHNVTAAGLQAAPQGAADKSLLDGWTRTAVC